jgi:hypothetical protein
VPASAEAVWDLRRQGVTDEWAPRAVAITDDRHPQYDAVAGAWLTSNPRGFARWFEAQAALGRPREHDRVAVASVEDVPAYEWRTPLQRAVQLLKRHRDVHFRQRPELAPISMIITNLAARAYQGELDLGEALVGIVDRMELFVNPVAPRIPNPTHPAEDYADKWRIRPDLQLERNFRLWMAQVRADVRNIAQEPANLDQLEKRFDIALSGEQRLGLTAAAGTAAARATATVPRVHTGPRPWRAL